MAQMTFNEVLTEARERKGYDMNTVARRLRIRPDILRAIEAGDFNAMPPRGYTRNMVNAYARLLGLNPTEIVNMYLDEAYAVQVQKARDRAPRSGFDMSEATPRRSKRRSTGGSRFDEESGPLLSRNRNSSSIGRDLYDDRTRFSRDDYGTTRANAGRADRSDKDFLSHHSGYPSTGFSFLDEDDGRRAHRSGEVRVGTTPMEYTASRIPSFLKSRTALIVIGIVVLAIIILLLMMALGNGGNSEEDDIAQLPVSGIVDTTETSADVTKKTEAKVEKAPEYALVAYSATSDEGCYVQIYESGSMTNEDMLDKTEKTVEVTGVWMIATYTPENLSFTVDGEKKELTSNANYSGMYTYTVDFDAILTAWEEAHPDAAKGKRSSSSNSSSERSATDDNTDSETTVIPTDANGTGMQTASDGNATEDTNTYEANGYDTAYDDGTYSYDDQSYDYTQDGAYYDDGTGYTY